MKSLLATLFALALSVSTAWGQLSPASSIKSNALSYTSSGVSFQQLTTVPPQYLSTTVWCKDCVADQAVCAAGGTGATATFKPSGWACGTPDPLLLNTLTGTGSVPTISGFNINGFISALAYGVKTDAQRLTDGAVAANASILTSASGLFLSTDCTGGAGCTGTVNKGICIGGDGASGLANCTTITSFNSTTSVGLAAAGNATGVTGATVWFGTDNKTSLDNAAAAAVPTAGNTAIKYNFFKQVVLPPGLMFVGSNLFFPNAVASVSLIGSGEGQSVLLLAGPGGGGNCSGVGTQGAQFSFQSSDAELGGIKFISINNAADCAVRIAGTSGNGAQTLLNVHDIEIYNDGEPASTTTSELNPIGLGLRNLLTARFTKIKVGVPVNKDGFRTDVMVLGGGLNMQDVSFQGQLNTQEDNVTAGVFGDSNYTFDCITRVAGCGMNVTLNLTIDGPLNGVGIGGAGISSVNLRLFTGDSPLLVSSDSPVIWMPSKAYAQSRFVIPGTSTTVNGACNAATATCVLTSVAGLVVNQRIYIQGAGSAGLRTDGFKILSISGSTVTLGANITNTVAVGTFVGWPTSPYAGHVYKQTATACTSGAAQPVFSTAINGQIGDNGCTWTEYGPSAWVSNSMTSGPSSVHIDGGYLSTGVVGVYDTSALPVDIHGSTFFQYGLSAIYCNGCSNLSVGTIHSTQNEEFGVGIVSGTAINIEAGAKFHTNFGSCVIGYSTLTTSTIGNTGSLCAFTNTIGNPIVAMALSGHFSGTTALPIPIVSTGTLSIGTGSTDTFGYFTVNAANPTASAAITFGTPFTTDAPRCVISEEATATAAQAMKVTSTTSAMTVAVPTDFHSDVIHYWCPSPRG